MIKVLRIPSPPWVCIAVSLLLGVLGLSQAEAPAQTPPIPQVRISGSPDKESRSGTMASSARSAAPTAEDARAPFPPTLLAPEFRPIDLNTALRLAGVQNPQLMIARQRVVEAAALRQLAAVQILPSINYGMNYDSHSGTLQQSNGNILAVNRTALYVGAGSRAIAAGTVSIPGVVLEGNVAVGIFTYLTSRQVVAQRQFTSEAVRNQTFLQTTLAYSELLRAEGRRAIALQVRDEAKRVADLTAAYANAGQGREADAHRALD